MSSAVIFFLCPMLLTINIPAIQRWYCMFTELYFKHNTVCQLTTDEELLQSPFEDNEDTNVLTFPQGKCNSQIRNVFIAAIRFFFFILLWQFWFSSNLLFKALYSCIFQSLAENGLKIYVCVMIYMKTIWQVNWVDN